MGPDPVDPDRWHRLSDIFHRALEQETDRRATFLDDACRGDPSLREEVESLLAYHERSDGLLDTPTHLVSPPTEIGRAHV